MKVLITGTAGFIGFHLANRLIESGDDVVGLDCINDYYDVNLKYDRLSEAGINKDDLVEGKLIKSTKHSNYRFCKLNLLDKDKLNEIFKIEKFDTVCNLAAQAGVRYSITNPYAYIESNIIGYINILESCRYYQVGHLVYASSSSVYGLNEKMPLSTDQNVDHPISLYAASKKSNELMAHTYSHLYGLPTTGLRFFTVYGPWGRPDMALFLFTKAIINNEPIDVYNNGNMVRDFTYIDDIIEGIVRVINNKPKGSADWNGIEPDPSTSKAPYKIYNIGNNNPVKLMDFINEIENKLGKKAIKNFMPLQKGDVLATFADVTSLVKDLEYRPSIPINKGVGSFIDWYLGYYKSV
jgi:UDP-glucuronate 4-epimerase